MLSKSKVLCYWYCPYKYKLCYIEGKKVETDEMRRGKEIHEIFKNVYEDLRYVRKIDYDLAIEKYWKEEYRKHLKNFVNFNWWIYNNVQDKKLALPIIVEEKFELKDKRINGIVDAVWKTSKSCLVLDFKTGMGFENSIDSLELAMYKSLLEGNGYNVTHWGFFFTGNNFFWKERANKEKEEEVLKKVELTRKLIEGGDFRKTNDKSKCRRCELYKIYCDGE